MAGLRALLASRASPFTEDNIEKAKFGLILTLLHIQHIQVVSVGFLQEQAQLN